ncbi:MAG: hypothetical protein SCARUB_02078 [Candidatus Scalindua rubra]|uniref:Uncharacterized protein n=1 Tax=Candidatus Scalindua rubra TaxID=1872076 RepID=A0A1E3XAX6_9BACT|nr:MAG: hypothetical protein SCARUB_02078 [Candidatus Scalindua rubra]
MSKIKVQMFEKIAKENYKQSFVEVDLFMKKEGNLYETLKKISKNLECLNIPFVICGAMALNYYGRMRMTIDIDILIKGDDLRKIHENLIGRGYVQQFENSKGIRDTETGVKIDFVIAGQYPGDKKEKPIVFPDPNEIKIEKDDFGVKYIGLREFIELKLASGMTSVTRGKDLSDVFELIKELNLPRKFGFQLNVYVQDQFFKLWDSQEEETGFNSM